MTSFAILARVPPTSAYTQTASATPSRAVCHAISGTASPRSAQKSAWSSRPLLADGRERPHRARELAPEDPGRELGQPLEVPVDLRDPHGELVAEGDRERLLPVGPAGLDRVPVAAREGGEQAADLAEVARHDGVARPELEDEPRVEDVLGGRAPVDELGRLRLAGARQGTGSAA